MGPEICVKAVADPALSGIADLVIAGDPDHLAATAHRFGLPVPAAMLPAGDASRVRPGELSAAAGEAAFQAVRAGLDLVLSGSADALVTAPINKEALRLAGYLWPGHTEMLAELTGASGVRMLLFSERLKVVHVTTHRSLRSAIDAATADRILETIQLAHQAGLRLGFERPRVAVCGLNPHAGEGGLFGDEEATRISPAVESARELGIECSGPWPADTLFWRAAAGEFDLVIAMYHDQGHVPVKLMGFDEGVNVSLGLPIIRTSVDHGTAFDIAGRGIARHQSLVAACRLACRLVGAGRPPGPPFPAPGPT